MVNTYNVVKPFMNLTPGDTFELNDNGTYTAEHNEEFNRSDDTFGDFKSSFNSKFTVSADYIKELVNNGIIEDNYPKKPFVNVFDEIDNMINTYSNELKNIDTDMANAPECLKVEKTTVLQNLIKSLDHLKSLRK